MNGAKGNHYEQLETKSQVGKETMNLNQDMLNDFDGRSIAKFDPVTARRSLVKVFREDDSFGLGFLAGNGLIITAAHCTPFHRLCWHPDNSELPGASAVEVRVQCVRSRNDATAVIMFSDSCSDVAVLGNRTFNGRNLSRPDMRAFDAVENALEPATVLTDELPVGKRCPVHLFTHKGKWLKGNVEVYDPGSPFLDIDLSETGCMLKPGTSGSPLFDDESRVVGIVSSAPTEENASNEADGVCMATALPGWVLRQLSNETI